MAASALLLALTACGGRAGDRDRVASSSWLGSCRGDGDCREGQCLCGVCTQSCEAASCSEGPPGSTCIAPSERAHERFCAGRDAPALCLVSCNAGACDDGFSCRYGVCLPEAVAALTPDEPEPSESADAGAELPPISLCANEPVIWRSLAIDDQRGYDALEGCERVDGDLRITVSDEADLSPLRSLRVVSGLLTIQGAAGLVVRATLPGLENIEHVGGLELTLPLSSLETFGQLRSVGPAVFAKGGSGQLRLQTGRLSDLTGLAALEEVVEILAEGEPLLSLAGVGNARVRGLSVSGTLVKDLSGLEALTGLERLALRNNPDIESLRGLPAAGTVTQLVADGNASLTSLDGLIVPSEMLSLTLVNCPLIDVTALAPLTSVTDALNIFSASIEHLDALANLRNVATLRIGENPNLVQADALAALVEVSQLEITRNAALLRLPAMPAVSGLREVTIAENPLLATGPAFPALTQASIIRVVDNPLLASVDAFSALQQVDSLVIARNVSLLELELAALTNVSNHLEIRSNGVLPSAEVAALRELPVAPIEVYISTTDAPALFDPCPFLTDAVCDEASGDCATGTDFGDCQRAGDP